MQLVCGGYKFTPAAAAIAVEYKYNKAHFSNSLMVQ